MSTAVKKFLFRSLLFALPFFLYGMLVMAIDPFNYFGVGGPVSTDLKEKISLKVNYAMWKMLDYRRDPEPNLLLGDSRMMSLDAQLVSSVSGISYVNMAYGGGSLREAIDTFWFAAERNELDNVYFGLNINSYNAGNTKDRVGEVLAALDNPLLYFTNNNVLIAGQKLVKAKVTGHVQPIGIPDMDREQFWNHQLNVITRIYFSQYRYPMEYKEELQEIAEYCRENRISLNFILFPNHMDLQDKIRDYKLSESCEAMRSDLREMGRVYDFAFPSPITENRDNYKDPYHFNDEIMRFIIESTWSEPGDIVKISGTPTVAN